MRSGWLDEAVKASKLPPATVFPRELADEVEIYLPVSLVPLPGLTCHQVRDWLVQRNNLRIEVPDQDRQIHGCMVAKRGRGFIFCEARDTAEVRRFTLAHEVAHFVLDHLLPRMNALAALGESILPVLDGEREPNPREGLSAMLKRIPLGVQVRLMDRDPSGAICSGKVDAVEHRADRLAFELLAPADQALPMLAGVPRTRAAEELASRFGLRRMEAAAYARILLGPRHQPFSIQKYFPEGEEE
ncbi:ImmA/IrrE family metallo-endopeptidase [Cystobacter fuscus]|uniref:ImmA/IrrE family metallo-endopeptidase n=1 Tax=Cystobacter fuscus TaxID=43 RepID=UPI002B321BCA|nr:ImmA/IrrE family metallo-endopeptidase [Cystobacter fuscus]